MEHLSTARLMELGLESSRKMGQEEANHLQTCFRCSTKIEEEKSLTSALSKIPPLGVPANFAQLVLARFVKESAIAIRTPLLICSIAMALLTGGMFWLAVANPAESAAGAAAALKAAVTCSWAFIVVLSHAPFSNTVLPFGLILVLLLSAFFLTTLAKKTVFLK